MQSVDESASQGSAAVSAEGTPAPKPVVTPGRFKVATSFVLTFKDDTGLSRTFNTFRRGPGWYRRVTKGTRVRSALSI